MEIEETIGSILKNIVGRQGEVFSTAKGLKFIYFVRGRTLFIQMFHNGKFYRIDISQIEYAVRTASLLQFVPWKRYYAPHIYRALLIDSRIAPKELQVGWPPKIGRFRVETRLRSRVQHRLSLPAQGTG